MQKFITDPNGEIGGTAEEDIASLIKESGTEKPVVAFIAGLTTPPSRRMEHAGGIVSAGKGTTQDKIKTLRETGATEVESPAKIGPAMHEVFKKRSFRIGGLDNSLTKLSNLGKDINYEAYTYHIQEVDFSKLKL